MKLFKKEKEDLTIEQTDCDVQQEYYSLCVYEHMPINKEGTPMRILIKKFYDTKNYLKSYYEKDFIKIAEEWYRVAQRYKLSDLEYAIVVENIIFYRDLDKYKINKDNNNEK